MNKYLALFLALVLLALSILGIFMIRKNMATFSSEKRVSETTLALINNIRNSDLIWSGSFAGVMPLEVTGATEKLKDTKEDINPYLVDALTDENRFVAAHVLLTWRTTESYIIRADEWNGLKIQLGSNGNVSFDGNDLKALQKEWKKRLNL